MFRADVDDAAYFFRGRSCFIGCAVCICALIAFLMVGTECGHRSSENLDAIVSDLVAAAQQPRTNNPFARELRNSLGGRTVKWHRITDRAVQFFGFNAVAHVELGLSDGSRLLVYVGTNGRECFGVEVERPTPRGGRVFHDAIKRRELRGKSK